MPNGRSTSVTLICEGCGEPFHPWKKSKPGRFCSRRCAPAGRQATTPEKPCLHCGAAFRPGKVNTIYCSRKCYRDSGTAKPTRNGAGYVLVYRPEHPAAYKSGQVLEHRILMEESIGRLLLPTETVHHRNGVKHDNRLANLELWTSSHPGGQRVSEVVAWAEEILALYADLPLTAV